MLGKVVYWLAVLAVSFLLVLALIKWLEARDESEVEGSWRAPVLVGSV